MNRIYHHYLLWEDWKAGMYGKFISEDETVLVEKCITLLSSQNHFKSACAAVIKNWPISSSENLTNVNQNRNAWMGAAACMYIHKAPEYITRLAWSKLDDLTRYNANKVATLEIAKYERKNFAVHKTMGRKMLF